LKSKLITEDSEEVLSWRSAGVAAPSFVNLNYIAGVDISFVKDSPTAEACAMMTILDYPKLNVRHFHSILFFFSENYM